MIARVALNLTWAIVLAAVLFCWGLSAGFYSFNERGRGPGVVDLSGTWKIKFEDSDVFKSAKLDDDSWCLISVPDSGQKPFEKSRASHSDCGRESYPRSKMAGHTFWYRKTFQLGDLHLDKPALFLGALKDEGWVYLDGKLIGSTRVESVPNVLLIPKSQIFPGEHTLAVRVQASRLRENPGWFHAYTEGVSIGEFSGFLTAFKVTERERFAGQSVAIVQLSALVILLLIAFRSGRATPSFIWLSVYFLSLTVCSVFHTNAFGIWSALISRVSIIGMSVSMACYGSELLRHRGPVVLFLRRIIIISGVMSIAVMAIAESRLLLAQLPQQIFVNLMSVLALVFTASSSVSVFRSRDAERWDRDTTLPEVFILVSLLIFHSLFVIDGVLLAGSATLFPIHQFGSVFTLVVLVLAIEDYVSKQRTLAFYGRFVRTGLRDLLAEHRSGDNATSKWIKGRKIPLMKIDIVNYSKSTFGMPYGIKRIFQDLWFLNVDVVLAGKSFFDKPEGDGSLYCIHDGIAGGSCAASLAAAEQIIKEAVLRFDREFVSKTKEFLKLNPAASEAMNSFFERSGVSAEEFWGRKTKVRFALVYGYVDEGLWGMTSQSHYDVQGDLLIIASRFEKLASACEIVASEEFLRQLRLENPAALDGFAVSIREGELKGIGIRRYAILTNKSWEIESAA